MICYRDMSFCDDADLCANKHKCDRYLSKEEISNAVKWWGNTNPPLCFANFANTCPNFKEFVKE